MFRKMMVSPRNGMTYLEVQQQKLIDKYDRLMFQRSQQLGFDFHQIFSNINEVLLKACELANLDDVNLAIEYGADVNYSQATNGTTPLIQASEAGNVDIVKILLSHGARVDDNKNNYNALMAAAEKGHELVVEELLRKGANPNYLNSRKMGPIHFAIQSDHMKVVKLLLQYKTNLNSNIKDCGSALDVAIYHCRFQMIPLIIANGGVMNSAWIKNIRINADNVTEETKEELKDAIIKGLKKLASDKRTMFAFFKKFTTAGELGEQVRHYLTTSDVANVSMTSKEMLSAEKIVEDTQEAESKFKLGNY